MNLPDWIKQLLPCRRESQYEAAMAMADELVETMRERSRAPDPFRSLIADMVLQRKDAALVANIFEMAQEAKIYQGPPPS